ncbi:MAG: hypothetical protein ACI9F9_003205 [Candidatus Paceibacteria bacterium]|jgi:hypothetical protein
MESLKGRPYTSALCPCSASDDSGEGCMNTTLVTGTTLAGSGDISLSSDSFHLHANGVPGDKPGLILMGANSWGLRGGMAAWVSWLATVYSAPVAKQDAVKCK